MQISLDGITYSFFWTDDSSVTYFPSKISEVFSTVFQNKLSDQVLNFPLTRFPNNKFTYFAFKTSVIKYYLKDLNPHGDLDPHTIFPFFLNKMLVVSQYYGELLYSKVALLLNSH